LITASTDGIIYIWKLPESLTKALTKLRTEVTKKEPPPALNKSEEFDFSLPEGETIIEDRPIQ
jgi:hypothetical protein